MGTITIDNIEDSIVAAIRRRAADHGVSLEEEIKRLLLATYLDDQQERGRRWALRQLKSLERGELPIAKISSLREIRGMRRCGRPA